MMPSDLVCIKPCHAACEKQKKRYVTIRTETTNNSIVHSLFRSMYRTDAADPLSVPPVNLDTSRYCFAISIIGKCYPASWTFLIRFETDTPLTRRTTPKSTTGITDEQLMRGASRQ